MNVASELGLGPTRILTKLSDGTTRLTVTPPAFLGRPSTHIVLTEEQVDRYHIWQTTGMLIQEAFPELSLDQREIILTGLGEEDFKEIFKDEEDEE